MKRRDFIKTTTAAGFTGILGQGCSLMGGSRRSEGPGFDLHPFIRQNPDAVFIYMTDVKSKRETQKIRDAGYTLAREVIVPVKTDGYPHSTKITYKPNWTCASPKDGKPVFEKLGTNTDPNFVEGWIQGMKTIGPRKHYIRECACPSQWEDMGWTAMAKRNGVDFRDLTSKHFWELKKGKDYHFIKIPDGVVSKEVAYMAPMNEPDTFFFNIAKFKAHGMGITASIKNVQGICSKTFHQFCTAYDGIRKYYPKEYHKFFHKNFEKHIEELHARHLKEGIPRWDRPGGQGGIWMEQWSQRMLDSLSVTPTGLNVVEGIYSQDGNGFGVGPHKKLGKYNVTSRDHMSNVVIFGIDPFRVDIITHWLGGHEPGNFGLFHLGIERGLSDVLDPHDIPVYIWNERQATLTKLENLERTPIVTYYLQRDYEGQNEPRFHLCNEPFDYSAWKSGKRTADSSPSIRQLGRDSDNNVVMGLTLPKRDDVYVDVLNKKGEVIWRLMADDLEPGVHQVVWDGFASPGLYNAYVKGMGWDAEQQIVTYS